MVAAPGKAAEVLGWRARFGLPEMVSSAWSAAQQVNVPVGC